MVIYNLCPECSMPIKALEQVEHGISVIRPLKLGIDKKPLWLTQKFEYEDERRDATFRCPECLRDICDSDDTAIALLKGKKVNTRKYGDIYLDGEFQRDDID